MSFKKLAGLAISILAINLMVLDDVSAETVKSKCRVRPSRSKVSVDGDGFTGTFYAVVKSGGITFQSAPQTADATREVEFDFDSNANDIAEGATAIPADFIKGRYVLGSIYDNATGRLVEDDRAVCRVKKAKN